MAQAGHRDVVIVILTWNGWADTESCLASLRDLAETPRLVLVDNGSTDGTVPKATAMFPDIEVLENGQNLGYAEGNNRGIRYALETGAEWIMVLNNDTVVDRGFLGPLIEACDSLGTVGYATPKIYYWGSDSAVWFGGGAIDWRTGWAHHLQPAPALDEGVYETPVGTGCCILAHRRTWEAVGTFDPRYFLYWEDSDWTVRVARAGGAGHVVAASRIWHRVSATALQDGSARSIFYFVRNGLLFIEKHGSGRLLVGLRFIVEWVLRSSVRDLRSKDRDAGRRMLMRGAGVLAYLTRAFGPAPGYVDRIASGPRRSRPKFPC